MAEKSKYLIGQIPNLSKMQKAKIKMQSDRAKVRIVVLTGIQNPVASREFSKC
jgi:hypothetical protein